jgi:hypothetical protein
MIAYRKQLDGLSYTFAKMLLSIALSHHPAADAHSLHILKSKKTLLGTEIVVLNELWNSKRLYKFAASETEMPADSYILRIKHLPVISLRLLCASYLVCCTDCFLIVSERLKN